MSNLVVHGQARDTEYKNTNTAHEKTVKPVTINEETISITESKMLLLRNLKKILYEN